MKLAIKGHPERGKEVIKLLEMLGGKNDLLLKGTQASKYFITNEGRIRNYIEVKCYVMSLEEFEEKYPYKVGEKVLYLNGRKEWVKGIIDKMLWIENNNTLTYYVNNIDGTSAGRATTMFLKPMKQKELKDYLKPGYVFEFDDGTKHVVVQDVHGNIFGVSIETATRWTLFNHLANIVAVYQIDAPSHLHNPTLEWYYLTKVWPKETELTMQQIADKFGIDVNQLKIKK
jgi:hypothetical protein